MQAHEIAPGSPEPLQSLASLKYECGDADNALAYLRRSMQSWWSAAQSSKLSDSPGDMQQDAAEADIAPSAGAAAGHAEVDALPENGQQDVTGGQRHDVDENLIGADVQPSYEFRLECCKLLIELDDSTDLAIQVCVHNSDNERTANIDCSVAHHAHTEKLHPLSAVQRFTRHAPCVSSEAFHSSRR